jgi:hypothetical protein
MGEAFPFGWMSSQHNGQRCRGSNMERRATWRGIDFVCTRDIRYSLVLDPFGEKRLGIEFRRLAVMRDTAGATTRLHLVRI